jgi:hypothetical protein
MVRSPSLPYVELFDMPLTYYFLWAYPNATEIYRETFDLAAYFLQK